MCVKAPFVFFKLGFGTSTDSEVGKISALSEQQGPGKGGSACQKEDCKCSQE